MTDMGNLVAIVGRPNVGKSTLFNRLTETKQAIISDEAGTTRDRQYGRCLWCGKEFSLVDTGGWVRNSDDVFEEAICDQVTLALEEADVILFVGMMTTAALLMVCYFAGVPDIIGMFVVMPGAIITAGLIQSSIK